MKAFDTGRRQATRFCPAFQGSVNKLVSSLPSLRCALQAGQCLRDHGRRRRALSARLDRTFHLLPAARTVWLALAPPAASVILPEHLAQTQPVLLLAELIDVSLWKEVSV